MEREANPTLQALEAGLAEAEREVHAAEARVEAYENALMRERDSGHVSQSEMDHAEANAFREANGW